MATGMRASGEGVVVLSCSDPRLNPYQILGLDPTLSESIASVDAPQCLRGLGVVALKSESY